MLLGCMLFAGTAAAQVQSPSGLSALDVTLYCSLAGRVQMPLAFATQDTTFALSLPQDEPAEVYVQVTVGRNGKVKEKLTRVNANHIATYVAPAFITATKNLSVDRSMLSGISGKDTSLLLTFTLEYQCILDTMSKTHWGKEYQTPPFYYTTGMAPYAYTQRPVTQKQRDIDIQKDIWGHYNIERNKSLRSEPTRIWYYVAALGAPQR